MSDLKLVIKKVVETKEKNNKEPTFDVYVEGVSAGVHVYHLRFIPACGRPFTVMEAADFKEAPHLTFLQRIATERDLTVRFFVSGASSTTEADIRI